MAETAKDKPVPGKVASPEHVLLVFVCENSGRAARTPTSGRRYRPETPDFGWPFPVQEVVVPCAGRLQPEHFLKAFEDGVDAIGVVACELGNCHHHEGGKRCQRRIESVAVTLEQVGLGKGRLLMFYLPGSASEDMALGVGATNLVTMNPTLKQKIETVRDGFVAAVGRLSPNPLRRAALPEDAPYEMESEDDSDE